MPRRIQTNATPYTLDLSGVGVDDTIYIKEWDENKQLHTARFAVTKTTVSQIQTANGVFCRLTGKELFGGDIDSHRQIVTSMPQRKDHLFLEDAKGNE